MTKGILIQMRGQVRSWGEKCFGFNRETLSHPTESAVLGLVKACVGISNEDIEQSNDWYKSWEVVTVSCYKHFNYLRDFQTTHGIIFANKGNATTKNTISNRYYLEGVVDYAFLVPKNNSPWQDHLNEVIERLNEPVYTPSLGRKSNSLSAPLLFEHSRLACVDAEHIIEMTKELIAQADCDDALVVAPMLMEDDGLKYIKKKKLSDRRNGYFRTYAERDAFYYQVNKIGKNHGDN